MLESNARRAACVATEAGSISVARSGRVGISAFEGRHTHTVNVRTLFENCVGKARKAVGAGPFTTLPDVSYCDP